MSQPFKITSISFTDAIYKMADKQRKRKKKSRKENVTFTKHMSELVKEEEERYKAKTQSK